MTVGHYESNLDGAGVRIGIVQARFNETVGNGLLSACLAELNRLGVLNEDILHVTVPGALEVPLALQKLADTNQFDALIALGAVIRGETYHFELVANEAARGIMDVSLRTGKPVIFGVLSTNTVEEANQRSRLDRGDNKGRDTAQAALEMIGILSKI